MSGYGFGSKKPPVDKPAGTIDLGGLPSSLPPLKREDRISSMVITGFPSVPTMSSA